MHSFCSKTLDMFEWANVSECHIIIIKTKTYIRCFFLSIFALHQALKKVVERIFKLKR